MAANDTTNYYVCTKCGLPCDVMQNSARLRAYRPSKKPLWQSLCCRAPVQVKSAKD